MTGLGKIFIYEEVSKTDHPDFKKPIGTDAYLANVSRRKQ
jgi:hypothetical protein